MTGREIGDRIVDVDVDVDLNLNLNLSVNVDVNATVVLDVDALRRQVSGQGQRPGWRSR